MIARVLLLPQNPAHPARFFAVDADGRIMQALEVAAGEELPAAFASAATRTVLVVPGSEVGTWATELPAREPAQALAAARLVLADRTAEGIEGLHIAIGPLQLRQSRQLYWVKSNLLRRWLERAAALGVQADAVIPDYLALPDPQEATMAAEHDARWLVRGPGLAFSAEPALARQVLGDRSLQWIADDALEARLVAGATQSRMNLLQYDFAPRRAADARDPSRRRLVVLAALVLASPLLLLAGDALRYQLAAHSLRARAGAIATPYLQAGQGGDPLARLATVLAQHEAPARTASLRQALFDSIATTPGTRLEALEANVEVGVQATIVHATPLQSQQLHDALASRGVSATQAPLETGADGMRTRLQLEQSP